MTKKEYDRTLKDPEAALAARDLPSVTENRQGEAIASPEEWEKHRADLIAMLEEGEYGKLPKKPEHLDVRILSENKDFYAGKAVFRKLLFTATNGDSELSFPVSAVIPKKPDEKIPAFVFLNFRPEVPDIYYPTEEVVDRGFAVFSFCYHDVSPDKNTFSDAGAKFLGKNRHAKNAPGKISMWAWAAMRVMDYVETLPEIDLSRVAVLGHSRLGKTALWTGANDPRFSFVISNDSGCSGAAISRGKIEEDKAIITGAFPHWFCPRYSEPTFVEELSFDQNALLALIPPRHLMVGSAIEDLWADPVSEFLGTYSANRIYALYGMRGLAAPEAIPSEPCVLDGGDAYYQLRSGTHYLSRADWNRYMDFIEKH